VRMAHLIETASSNFIFGLLVGWLLMRDEGRGARVDARQIWTKKEA